MELKQSWIVTCAKGKLSLYEVRLIIKIVEYAHNQIKETILARNMCRIKNHCDDVRLTIPMRYLLSDGSNHYEDVYEGARNLCKRTMEFYNSTTKTWHCSSIIFDVVHEVNKGLLSFTVFGSFFDCLYDFTHGFSRYDLEQAMSMRCPSSVRLFMLMYGQLAPKHFSISWLKETMGVADKYKQTADFIKKCIKPACEEITDKTSIKLFFKPEKDGNKIVSIQFSVERKPQPERNISALTVEMKKLLQRDINLYLVSDAGFTYRELAAHKPILQRLMEHPCAIDIVRSITHRARKQGKSKGWIINALRSELFPEAKK